MDNKILVNNIKKLCLDNDISISALEKEMYMSPGLISRWTKNTPALDRIIDIANYFHVSLDVLVGNANEEKINDNKKIYRMLLTLYNKSRDAEIEWQIFNPETAEDTILTQKISSIVNPNNMDCFFCNINAGSFILTINYSENENELSLYVLADQNSIPELTCSDNEKLSKLYEYLSKRYSKQLNTIKTDNFIDEFISQYNNILSDGKITVLKSAVND